MAERPNYVIVFIGLAVMALAAFVVATGWIWKDETTEEDPLSEQIESTEDSEATNVIDVPTLVEDVADAPKPEESQDVSLKVTIWRA